MFGVKAAAIDPCIYVSHKPQMASNGWVERHWKSRTAPSSLSSHTHTHTHTHTQIKAHKLKVCSLTQYTLETDNLWSTQCIWKNTWNASHTYKHSTNQYTHWGREENNWVLTFVGEKPDQGAINSYISFIMENKNTKREREREGEREEGGGSAKQRENATGSWYRSVGVQRW